MPKRHSSRAPFLSFLLLLVASAIGAPRLSHSPPGDIDLSGNWILNADRSDVPSQRIEAALKYAAPPPRGGPGGGGGHRGRGGGGHRGGTGGEGHAGAGGHASAADAEALVPKEKNLNVEQAPDSLQFTYEGGWRHLWHYLDEEHEAIAQQDATVTTGWDGPRYVVYAELHNGLTLIERYALSKDKQQLMVGSEIRFPRRDVSAEMLRVFDRAPTTTAP